MSDDTTVTQADEGASVTRDWDGEARTGGWLPKEEYKGAKPWIDAETFVKRGEEILPIVSAENRKLKQSINELKNTTAQLVSVMNNTLAKERAEKENYIRQLEGMKAKAIDEGKGADVVQLDREIANARASTNTQPTQALDPYAQTWQAENDWYGRDRRLTAFADGLAAQYRADHPSWTWRDLLDHVGNEIKTVNGGGKVERKPASAEAPTATTTARKTTQKGPTWDDLPADVKSVAERMIKQVGGAKDKDGNARLTKESYAKQYFGQ